MLSMQSIPILVCMSTLPCVYLQKIIGFLCSYVGFENEWHCEIVGAHPMLQNPWLETIVPTPLKAGYPLYERQKRNALWTRRIVLAMHAVETIHVVVTPLNKTCCVILRTVHRGQQTSDEVKSASKSSLVNEVKLEVFFVASSIQKRSFHLFSGLHEPWEHAGTTQPHSHFTNLSRSKTDIEPSRCLPEPMLKRLVSYGRSSSSAGLDDDPEIERSKKRKSSGAKAKPTKLNTPVMRLAMSKIARGHSASLMSELAKASVEEAGVSNVSESA